MLDLFVKDFRLRFILFLSVFILISCGGGDDAAVNDNGLANKGPDTQPPVITLNGANPLTLNQGATYAEPGATAIDDIDGNVDVTVTGSVNTNTPNKYTITYSATDSANNTTTVTRTVDVVVADIMPPIITLNGANPIALLIGDTYIEPGATATDDVDGNVNVTITGSVDVNTPGSYTITYSAVDSASNTNMVTRTVDVVAADITPPVITLNGANPITLQIGDTYIEPGGTATDDVDGNVSVSITGTVDTNTLGSYNIIYSTTDNANNTSTTTRKIDIVTSISRPFVTTWKTDNPGVTASNQIKISTIGNGYNYTVDWGDGLTDNNVTAGINGGITHTYATAGTYTVTISGDFPRMVSNNFNTDAEKLLSIEQWGDIKWQSMNGAFSGCINLLGNAVDVPDLSQVIDMSYMFQDARVFNQDLSAWNVSSITNMAGIFFGARAFNQDLSVWNVSSVTDMSGMFNGASAFNQDLSAWDVSSVTDMSGMFAGAAGFNENISTWNVSSVTDMGYMFSFAGAFNQDLSAWDVSSVTNMSSMFHYAGAFDQDLSTWDVSSVTHMPEMFGDASVFNQDLSTWDVSSVINTSAMFYRASAFNQDLSAWNVSLVTIMFDMFNQASAFNQDISLWDVSLVTSMRNMFRTATAFNGNISTWNVSSVTNMSGMFLGAHAFNQDLSAWDVSSVTDMKHMFDSAFVFNQDISAWDVSSVTNMGAMFSNSWIFNQDISTWNVSLVTDMSYMFGLANNFNQDLSAWDVSSVITMDGMFSGIALSTTNYDALLLGWSAQSLQNGVIFSGGDSQYSSSSQAVRDTLTNSFGWKVTDGGVAPQ